MENSFTKRREQQEDLKEDIRKDAEDRITDDMELTFRLLHDTYNTVSGDITPRQQDNLNRLIKQISELVAEQVYQNIKQ